jgi:hypothetical protein
VVRSIICFSVSSDYLYFQIYQYDDLLSQDAQALIGDGNHHTSILASIAEGNSCIKYPHIVYCSIHFEEG